MSKFNVGDKVRLRGMKRTAVIVERYQFPDPSRREMAKLNRELSMSRTSSHTWPISDLEMVWRGVT